MKKFLFFIVLFLIQLTPIHGQWIQQMRIADQKAKEENGKKLPIYTRQLSTPLPTILPRQNVCNIEPRATSILTATTLLCQIMRVPLPS